jgi:hypothetical protein
MSGVYFDSALDDDERRRRLYAGSVFIRSASAASRAMANLAQCMLEEAFAPFDPRTVHEHMSPEDVSKVLGSLKPQFVHHPECKRLISQILEDNGADSAKTYFDVPRLRSAYPSHFLSSGIAYAFHPHRDTWYSAPASQINWWFPIYEIEPSNAMAFYPQYFSQPVKNNSEVYNYYEWNTKHRATAVQHVRSDTREQPKPQEALQGPTISYLPPPSGIIMFSGAQLHETVPNTSNVARYSIDFRTVHLDDVIAHAGAANVDTRCTGTTMRDYLRASDLEHLPEEVIRTYDDGTEGNAKVLYFGDRLVSEQAPT